MLTTYQLRKMRGVCTYCGGERDDKKYSLCSNCRQYHRDAYHKLKERMTPAEYRAYISKRAETSNARMKRLRSEGKCIRCMGPSPDKWVCDACRQKMKEQEGLVRRE